LTARGRWANTAESWPVRCMQDVTGLNAVPLQARRAEREPGVRAQPAAIPTTGYRVLTPESLRWSLLALALMAEEVSV
jgi:hypothetical protein